ncbi:MAG: threonine ammonia-lyase [Alphaproteobacteria bacterium]|nr:threonine ammonia-lyase [Alphaproteobacteria bacterium]
MSLQFEDVQKAYDAIKNSVIRTPTVRAARLSVHLGIDLYLKLENLQYTNAFKARGALNKLLTLDEKQRTAGVIAVSAGTHAQGVAFQAQQLGIPATIVMPKHTPFNKIAKTKDFGAEVVLHGETLIESMNETMRLAKKDGLVFIHPYDDQAVVAGQGTIGLEMMEQRPDLDAIVVPIGGGGMMAGVATAVKGINPKVEIIGAQVDSYAAVKAQIDGSNGGAGGTTLAEGIAVREPSKANIEVIRKLVSKVDAVNDNEIEDAIFDLLRDEKLVAEGAAGAGLAVIKKNLAHFKGRKVGLVVCGGNIDSRLLSTLIMRGLIREGRITRLRFEIDDTPGQLADIARIFSESGANVIEVIHQRMMQTVSLKRAELDVVIEARDNIHVEEIVAALRKRGFVVNVMSEV